MSLDGERRIANAIWSHLCGCRRRGQKQWTGALEAEAESTGGLEGLQQTVKSVN
jgi:hypothetical protein